MKVAIEQWELQRAIEKAKNILHRAALPILGSVLLSADGNNNITLTASNLESSIIINLCGSVEESGQVTIDKSNFKLIKKLKDRLCITNDGNTVKISGNRELKFKQYKPSEYPEIKTEVNYEAFIIQESELKDSLKIKTFASKDECRPIMCSCCINKDRIIAIDGFRLAVIDLNINNKCDKNIVIPIQSITELDKILDKKSTRELKFEYFSDRDTLKYLKITGYDYQYITKLVEGTYFNVDNYLPKEFAFNIDVKKDALNESLEFAKEVLSNTKLPVVFNIAEEFKVCGKNEDKQFSEIILEDIDIGQGNYVKIGFIPSYLTDVFKLLQDSIVKLSFVGSSISPLVITGNKTENETYMILPFRIPYEI